MSVGSRTQPASIPGNGSTRDIDLPPSAQHSALRYLFQEVSKLASPKSNTFSGTNSWLDEEEANSQKTSGQMFPPGVAHAGPNSRENQAKDKSGTVAATVVQSHLEGNNSPWKVLSLINLQCERLLHRTDGGESDLSFGSSLKLANSLNHASDAIASDVSEQGGGAAGVCISVECTLRPSLGGREEGRSPLGFGGPAEGSRGAEVRRLKPDGCVKDSMLGRHAQPQRAARLDVRRAVLLEGDAPAASKTRCRDANIPRAASSKNCLSHAASHRTWKIFNSDADASLLLPVGALASDAKLVLIAAPSTDSQGHPLSAQRSFRERRPSPPAQSDAASAALRERSSVSAEGSGDAGASVTSWDGTPLESKAEASVARVEGGAAPAVKHRRSKTPRKQAHPSRSVDIRDPDLQGVTFRMDPELDDSRHQCRLLITSMYRKQPCKRARKPWSRTRTSQKSFRTGSSDDECEQTAPSASKGKVCASCSTGKTPMWRDAEDGTPLCNACGIRYKKYRVRCISCWHIPRKEGNSSTRCIKCGSAVRPSAVRPSAVRPSSALRKHCA